MSARPDTHHLLARYAASVILSITYGKTEPTYFTDPEVITIAQHGARLGKIVQIGSHIVDKYPLLSYVPFITARLRRWHREEQALFTSQVDVVRQKMVSLQSAIILLVTLVIIGSYVANSHGTAVFRDLSHRPPRRVWSFGQRACIPRRLHVRCRL